MTIDAIAMLLACLLIPMSGGSMRESRALGAASDVPPDFGPNVLVLDPAGPDNQERINAVFAMQEASQFGPERRAILFKPGVYNLNIPVGFYTHVAGLGRVPGDVMVNGRMTSNAAWRNGNATCNFWRCAENLTIAPGAGAEPIMWAVSQGTSLRRVHVKGDLTLCDSGWSSGGFLADCRIDGTVNSGTQQQWFSRNADWGVWKGGNWNMVFVGVTKPPEGAWPAQPYTVIDQTPVIREKPYLFVEGSQFFVMLPPVRANGSAGTTWGDGTSPGTPLPIDRFYLARSDRDTAASINAALAGGKHLVLTPGVYHLEAAIRVERAGTVVLGLGYPTLIPDAGTPAMEIADVDGVTLAGVLFEAGKAESPTLLRVGEKGRTASHAADPIVLSDICCRAGGASVGVTDCMVNIHSSNVVGDNWWLWRADHGEGAAWGANRNCNGLIVDGDDVTIYALFVEHNQEYQTIWNGQRGRVYFYQSEMPYDPPSQAAWSHDGVRGYASYKVADGVTSHEAWGLGVYCVFRGAPVIADTAIEAPDAPGVRLHHMITIRLSGLPESGIAHVINRRGDPVIHAKRAVVD